MVSGHTDGLEANQLNSNQPKPNQTKSNQLKPTQTKPNQIKPNQISLQGTYIAEVSNETGAGEGRREVLTDGVCHDSLQVLGV
jgi:hypothetical protein